MYHISSHRSMVIYNSMTCPKVLARSLSDKSETRIHGTFS